MSEPLSQTVKITNRRGLHARASAKFVTMASGLTADVQVAKDGPAVVGTSIMGLMMLGAAMGDSITISATGQDAHVALEQLVTLVEDKFGEE
ncbi:HPr family phosphocarrier protein [Sphingobium sufflavum]|uniref:HPr family phosphocarrier protein n=1 Tax=Sphingobium sufflavum TaxID=1129547 RepID=UPI001F3626AD|nr:HPr family phosphocarrier protein [Sphingobium sufflavum]MCE7797815.1 HPr family phosphocarrier protein [Sphingobium sufflavum]